MKQNVTVNKSVQVSFAGSPAVKAYWTDRQTVEKCLPNLPEQKPTFLNKK